MQIPNMNIYLLSIYSSQNLQTFQVNAGLEFNCRFLVF